MREQEKEWIDKLRELYRADGESSIKYAHSEGYCFYFLDIKDKSRHFPGMAYAKFNDFDFTYIVMSVMGDTLEVPADVFRSIWIVKDDQWENIEPIQSDGEESEQLPNYAAGIQKDGDMLSVYGFSIAMPDSIVLEYDLSDGSCKRVLIDDGQYVIPMYPRHPFLCRNVNEKECNMMSFMGIKTEKPDRIVLDYGVAPYFDGRRIIISDDNMEVIDSSVEWKGTPKPEPCTAADDDDEERSYEE